MTNPYRRLDPRLAVVFYALVAVNLLVVLVARSTSFGDSVAYPIVSLVLLVALAIAAFRLLRAVFRKGSA